MINRLVLAALLACPVLAAAQMPAEFRNRTAAELARDAIASRYGQLLVADAGRILRDSADPACLRERGLEKADFEARAREMYVRNGTRMYETFDALVETQKFNAAFDQLAGPNGRQDYRRLRDNPLVVRFRAIIDRMQLASAAETIVENIDRHALLMRIKLARRLSPLASGNMDLLTVGEQESSLDPVDDFIAKNRTPDFERWLDLLNFIAEAGQKSMRTENALLLGPIQYTPDAAADLEKLCVPSR